MELASMLAGEPFTDHPKSVSRVLRGYNDLLDDAPRQTLYEYAARSVGTVAGDEVESMRSERLIAWSDAIIRRRVRWSVLARICRPHALRERARTDPEAAAQYAIRAIRKLTDETHVAVRSLIDELIAMGAQSGPAPRLRRTQPAPSAPPSANTA
jgi:hypothetical protein